MALAYTNWRSQTDHTLKLAYALAHAAELVALMETRKLTMNSDGKSMSVQDLAAAHADVTKWLDAVEQGPRSLTAGGLGRIRQDRN